MAETRNPIRPCAADGDRMRRGAPRGISRMRMARLDRHDNDARAVHSERREAEDIEFGRAVCHRQWRSRQRCIRGGYAKKRFR